MDKLEFILTQCVEWTNSFLKNKTENPNNLDNEEILAVSIYTYDLYLNQGKREENFYFQLNRMLRKRSSQDFGKWRGYLYYLQNALDKIDTFKGTVYRGIPEEHVDSIQTEYTEDRPIFWSGYTSSTPDIDVAKNFANEKGIILKIKINNGKVIKKYSYITQEDEVLIRPNSKFIVKKALYKGDDDYYYVELKEMEQTLVDFKV